MIAVGGIKNRVAYINEKELKGTIKLMKEERITDKCGMRAAYIKALGDWI